MKYRKTVQIDNRQFNDTGIVDAKVFFTEHIIKKVIFDLLESVPIEDLKKIFNVTVIEDFIHPIGKVTNVTASLNINE